MFEKIIFNAAEPSTWPKYLIDGEDTGVAPDLTTHEELGSGLKWLGVDGRDMSLYGNGVILYLNDMGIETNASFVEEEDEEKIWALGQISNFTFINSKGGVSNAAFSWEIEEAPAEIVEEPADEVVDEPVDEEIVEEPAVEVVDEPVDEEIVEEPAVEVVDEPVDEEIVEEPAVEVVDEEIVEEPAVEVVDEEIDEEIVEEPAVEAVDEEIVEEIVEEPAVEAVDEEIVEEPIKDSDGDGTPDIADAFPLDPSEDTDTDGDGIGNNVDTDDDEDGTPDSEDPFPLDPSKDTDTNGDGGFAKTAPRALPDLGFDCDYYPQTIDGNNSLLNAFTSTDEEIKEYEEKVQNWFEERGITQDDLGPNVEGIDIFSELKDAEMKAIQKRVLIEECITSRTEDDEEFKLRVEAGGPWHYLTPDELSKEEPKEEPVGEGDEEGEAKLGILGCTEPTAMNYNPEATTDDGSCQYGDSEGEGDGEEAKGEPLGEGGDGPWDTNILVDCYQNWEFDPNMKGEDILFPLSSTYPYYHRVELDSVISQFTVALLAYGADGDSIQNFLQAIGLGQPSKEEPKEEPKEGVEGGKEMVQKFDHEYITTGSDMAIFLTQFNSEIIIYNEALNEIESLLIESKENFKKAQNLDGEFVTRRENIVTVVDDVNTKQVEKIADLELKLDEEESKSNEIKESMQIKVSEVNVRNNKIDTDEVMSKFKTQVRTTSLDTRRGTLKETMETVSATMERDVKSEKGDEIKAAKEEVSLVIGELVTKDNMAGSAATNGEKPKK